MGNRTERDALGSVKVPDNAYYGSETQRAVENFPISGMRVSKDFILTYVMLKRSTAFANMSTGKLDKKKGNAIVKACNEVLKGKLSDQFVLDVFQAGAGTSTNMNVNEVLANRAIEILGGKKGNYKIIHPNDHVNMSQSTNDTYPSVIAISTYIASREKLLKSLMRLHNELTKKSKGFSNIVKIGRTHLQDAVPMTLGQEFSGYTGSVEEMIKLLERASKSLLPLPLGGTAVGTGINADKEYTRMVIEQINKSTGSEFTIARDVFTRMQSRVGELEFSNALRETSILLGKIANDFRLLNSGPRAGIGELILPEVQPGSSIMPGKVNPSMAEMLNMVCFQVIGNTTTISEAAAAGQLELNVFMPVIGFNLMFSIEILSNAIDSFTKRCVTGIKANTFRIKEHLDSNLSLATALTPYIGYAKAAEIARLAYHKNKTIKQVCIDMKIMDKKQLDRILDPKRLI